MDVNIYIRYLNFLSGGLFFNRARVSVYSCVRAQREGKIEYCELEQSARLPRIRN